MPVGKRRQPCKRHPYIIRCISKSSLYWNNDMGWVSKDYATSFTKKERFNLLSLPMGGAWFKAVRHA